MREYRITETAGTWVAGHRNTGAGTSLWLSETQAAYEVAQGTIVPVDPAPAPAEAAPAPARNFSAMSKAELVALANERGIAVDPKDTKAAIIASLNGAAGTGA